MKRLALVLLAAIAGCVAPSQPPPGQVKKPLFRCEKCGTTSTSADLCDGRIMIPIP